MITTSLLREIINSQKERQNELDPGLLRVSLADFPDLLSYAVIISGIRRCGKSTLLYQIIRNKYPEGLFLNFEDPRLYEFEKNDFMHLDEICQEENYSTLLFDEIQIIEGWERYIRQKLDEGLRVIITGSNASLLGRELATKLTGRHIIRELFPFSFHEFRTFLEIEANEDSAFSYLKVGGMPQYVKTRRTEIQSQLFHDILIRDISVRYNIRDTKTLQRIAQYLVSNVGKLITANQLRKTFEIGSTSTIIEYLSHLENAYLFYFVAKFSYSLKKQSVNPRKVYAIDTGLVSVNSSSFTDDYGSRFENLIYLHLRRNFKEIYYYSEKGECDFVVFKNNSIHSLVQVCYSLNQDNIKRETNGLLEAMNFFDLKKGYIITFKQNDKLLIKNKTIQVIPSYQYMDHP